MPSVAVEDLSSGDATPLKGPAPKALQEGSDEDAMPLTNPGDQQVQFVPGQPANGDAKVEIGVVGGTPSFVGLGKEELMKYANDPFWVRLRWLLFILFWALWVSMLVGAIIIIVLAPKCTDKKPVPESFYEMNLRNFAKDGKLADVNDRVNYLSEMGVTAVILDDVLNTDEKGGILDYKNIDERIGTMSEFTEVLKKIKSAGIRVLMTLVPNHSSLKHPWFMNHALHDYYVRKANNEVSGSTWKQVDSNQDAWISDPHMPDLKYLGLFSGKAELNYHNQEVVNVMAGVFSYWRGKGVDGFVIPAASYLVEDLSNLGNRSAILNQPKNLEILRTILSQQSTHSLAEVTQLSSEDAEKYIAQGIVPVSNDYDYLKSIGQRIPGGSLASKTDTFFKEVHQANHPIVRLSGPSGRLQGTNNKDDANIVRLLAYTSNAGVIMYFGDEVEGFGSQTKNNIDWNKATVEGETFTYLKNLAEVQRLLQTGNNKGFTYPYKGSNQEIIAFVKSNKYVVLANFGSSAKLDIGELLEDVGAKAKVLIATPNAPPDLQNGSTVTGEFTLPQKSGVLLEKIEPGE